MVVKYDVSGQRLVVTDAAGKTLFTLDGPTPSDIHFWVSSAARSRRAA